MQNYSLETIKCRVIHFSVLSSEETILVTSTKHTENKGQFQKGLREKNSDYTILPSHSRQTIHASTWRFCFQEKVFHILNFQRILNLLTLPEHTLKKQQNNAEFSCSLKRSHYSELNLITSFIYALEMNIHSALFSSGHKFPIQVHFIKKHI